MIQTSVLLTPGTAKEGNVVATMNSRYLLVGPGRSLEQLMVERNHEVFRAAAEATRSNEGSSPDEQIDK